MIFSPVYFYSTYQDIQSLTVLFWAQWGFKWCCRSCHLSSSPNGNFSGRAASLPFLCLSPCPHPAWMCVCKRGLDNEEGAAGEGERDKEQLLWKQFLEMCQTLSSLVINELSLCSCQLGVRGGSALRTVPFSSFYALRFFLTTFSLFY